MRQPLFRDVSIVEERYLNRAGVVKAENEKCSIYNTATGFVKAGKNTCSIFNTVPGSVKTGKKNFREL